MNSYQKSVFSTIIKKSFKYLILFFFLASTKFVDAQSTFSYGRHVNFRHYTNEDGFFSTGIRCLFQDSKGLIWIGCQDGLSVFNGHDFYNFSFKDGLSLYDIGSICEDNYGRMWIGTNNGIFIYNEGKFKQLDTSKGMAPKKMAWTLFKDVDGSIWAGTVKGVFHFNARHLENALIKHYALAGSAGSNSIRLIKRRKDGRLIAGGDEGLFIYKPDSFYRMNNMPNRFYSQVDLENNKELYTGFGSPVFQFKNGKLDSVINVGGGALAITKDKLNNIWIATWENGVLKYDNKNLTHYSYKEGLDYNSFWSCLTDYEGNVWLGSFGNGLYKYTGEVFTNISEKTGLFSNNIVASIQDTSGNTWIASENSISCYNSKTNSVTNYTSCNNTSLGMIQCLLLSNKNEILALRYGHFGYRIANNKITTEPWLAGFAGVVGKEGEYYIGYEDCVMKINADKTSEKIIGKKRRINPVNNMYQDPFQNLWVLNPFYGIILYNGQRGVMFSEKNGFTNAAATSIFSDDKNNYWIGTKGKGIYKCMITSDTTLKITDSITTLNGLGSDIINSVHIYDNNMLIGTAYGLGILNMSDYQKGIKKVKMYTSDEGIVSSNCSVSFIDKNGKAWIKTNHGVFIFDESSQIFNSEEPKTIIQNIELFYEPVDWASRGYFVNKDGLPMDMTLSYDQNNLTFNFIGICHSAPNKVQYQYRLLGSNESWSPISLKNEAVYSNITPGTYTFQVKSCNNDEVWNKTPTTFVFTIIPPFWKRLWFYGLLLVLISFSVYVVIRFRERKLKEQNEELERKINERTQQLKDAFAEIEEKNKDITDSINYAKRIQEAILPEKDLKYKLFPNAFILYMPRDIVSGDFYWFAETKNKRLIAAVDCTGHGVPGAFMSLIGSTILNELVNVQGLTKPSDILNKLRDQIIISLKQSDGINKDGMDISLLCFDDKNNTVEFAGANNPLWISRDDQWVEIKADKQPVGYFGGDAKPFTNHTIEHKPNDVFYIFTDGYADQFGGEKGKKYKYSHLKEFLIRTRSVKIINQEQMLIDEFNNWKGHLEQVDDVCIIGIMV